MTQEVDLELVIPLNEVHCHQEPKTNVGALLQSFPAEEQQGSKRDAPLSLDRIGLMNCSTTGDAVCEASWPPFPPPALPVHAPALIMGAARRRSACMQ